jgi:hypothetical protein
MLPLNPTLGCMIIGSPMLSKGRVDSLTDYRRLVFCPMNLNLIEVMKNNYIIDNITEISFMEPTWFLRNMGYRIEIE